MPALVSALNSVDLPTLGRPTMPQRRLISSGVFGRLREPNEAALLRLPASAGFRGSGLRASGFLASRLLALGFSPSGFVLRAFLSARALPSAFRSDAVQLQHRALHVARQHEREDLERAPIAASMSARSSCEGLFST